MTCEKCPYLEIHDAVNKDSDEIYQLLREAENEMRYAGWDKRKADNATRTDVYEKVKSILEKNK